MSKVKINYPKDFERRIYGHPLYEIFLKFFFRIFKLKNDVFLDVGAHVGEYSIFMALYNPKGIIISIEPHPLNFKFLLENIKRNNIKNIVPLRIAALDKGGKVKLFESIFSGGHSVSKHFKKFIWVECKTIDEILKEMNLSRRIRLVKIDVNGAEEKVLKGMKNILKKDKPFLIVERYRYKDALKVKKFLQRFGYRKMIRIGKINYLYF